MKLDQETISYLLNVVKTARLVGIDNIIIEPNLVRAMDDANTVVLFQNKDVMEMPFGSIGLTRTDAFMARYEVARSQDKFTMEAVVHDDTEYARSLVMKGKGVKIDYRCGDPSKIKAPRQVNDTLMFSVGLTGEAVAILQKGQAAMGVDTVSVVSNDGVSFELTDVNGDTFKYTFADDAEPLSDDTNTKFVHRYPVKTLLALFKNNPEGKFSIGAKGILSFPINGVTVFVLPQV
jgi:hypothetical protein